MVANDWSLLCREWKRSTCIRSPNTGPWCWPGLCFAVFYFALTCVGHDGTASAAGRKERADQMFISTAASVSAFSAQQGVNICDLNKTWASQDAEKGIMSALYFCIITCDDKHFSWFSPSGLSSCLMSYCGVSRQLFPCCFYFLWLLCGRSIVGASDHSCTIAVSSTSSWFSTCGWFKSLQNLL